MSSFWSWYVVLWVLVCRPFGPGMSSYGSWYVVLLVLVCRPMGPGMSSFGSWYVVLLVLVCRPFGPGMSSFGSWYVVLWVLVCRPDGPGIVEILGSRYVVLGSLGFWRSLGSGNPLGLLSLVSLGPGILSLVPGKFGGPGIFGVFCSLVLVCCPMGPGMLS
jgi:hypothetical protein